MVADSHSFVWGEFEGPESFVYELLVLLLLNELLLLFWFELFQLDEFRFEFPLTHVFPSFMPIL